jgi:hypothetical protein
MEYMLSLGSAFRASSLIGRFAPPTMRGVCENVRLVSLILTCLLRFLLDHFYAWSCCAASDAV